MISCFPHQVSILVFLDLALRAIQSWGGAVLDLRFNPCFLGSCSPRAEAVCQGISRMSGFNPCFLGSCSPSQRIDSTKTRCGGFNPCFLGSCSPRPGQSQGYKQYCVSILVFLDLALRGRYGAPLRSQRGCVSILVFLDLALRGWKELFSGGFLSCFNPCFLGSCSPSR